jgi:EAL domain-containing protein (putative c-di-GMP-specific phosphodiesterase class I)
VRFALDDFGTGYSSLVHLKHLGADVLKIDQTFVRDMLDDPGDLAIVQGVIGLADAFHRDVVAEGVEDLAHIRSLLESGCHVMQGYGISRPLPTEHLDLWLESFEPDPAWQRVNAAPLH